MSDLQTLADENNFIEFFDHALDIRPSERLEKWKEMVTKMAESYAQSITTKAPVEKKDFYKIENLFTWPSLKSNDIFKQRRQEIGLKYLTNCFKTKPHCWKDLSHFWDKDKQDTDLAIKLAELTLTIEPKTISTWDFLETALKGPLSEFYCQKEFVQNSIWEKLELDYVRLNKKGDLLKKIDQTLHHDCLIPFNKWAGSVFLNPRKIEDRELAFQILEAQGKADGQLKDLFYSIYLLENPSKGDLFNLSWNRLIELSKSEVRRSRVLEEIKKIDPLPDALMSSSDLGKKKAILLHFKHHFPEYIQFYVEQCLQYYQGTSSFKNGNPTIRCQELMKSDFIEQIIDKEKIKQYQKTQFI
jgi:hypothetical protein